ncbi:hypothetical protein [Deinococcus altitudinis]|uniref:hypothetical protein n=1 Tax=Deinococcus altitudinis TaxID=468914 RepID=UPI0038918BB5
MSLFANPLIVQFWLFGLDASGGLLRTRGFGRGPELRHGKAYGSSRYGLDGLELHSSGLTLHLPQGELTYHRPRQSFRLNREPLARSAGLALLQPYIHQHEAWTESHLPGLRARQLGAPLPRPVRREVGTWHLWATRALELETWRPLEAGGPPAQLWPLPLQPASGQLAAGLAAHAGQRP